MAPELGGAAGDTWADDLDFWPRLGHVLCEMSTEKLLPASEAHEPFDSEPVQSLPPDEKPSPLWLPAVGAALALCAVVAWLLVGGDDVQGSAPGASARSTASAAPAAAEAKAPTAAPRKAPGPPATALPRQRPPTRPAPADRRAAPRGPRPPQRPAPTAAPKPQP